jgi:uncharacterized membrane protein YeaQ/YmgE (transglycosylase-associated protein family)
VRYRTDVTASSDQACSGIRDGGTASTVSHGIAVQPESLMSIIAWMILGLIAGFVASKIVNRTGEGVILDVLLGIGGAVVGGWLFHLFGMRGVTGLNLYSMFVATLGAAAVLVVYHGLFRRSHLRRF